MYVLFIPLQISWQPTPIASFLSRQVSKRSFLHTVAILFASRRSSRVTSGSVAFSVIFVINTYIWCGSFLFTYPQLSWQPTQIASFFSSQVAKRSLPLSFAIMSPSSRVKSGSVVFSVIYVINTYMSWCARSVYTSSDILTAYYNRVILSYAPSPSCPLRVAVVA